MDKEDLRKLCAQKAIEYIKDGSIIGLGAGRTITCLIELLSKEVNESNFKIKAVTPSDSIKKLCIEYGIEVLPTGFIGEVDIAFDGCAEVDENFYASKGGGGVFTKEKIIGSMAKEYILLIDEEKLKIKLDLANPISLEVIKDSLGYVSEMIKKLGGKSVVRTSSNKDGYLITDDGNVILDVKFDEIKDFEELNNTLNNIAGVVGSSLFTKEVTALIIAGENGVRVIKKEVES